MLRVGFAGTFAKTLAEPVRRTLAMPAEVVLADEDGILSDLAELDVLVSLAFSAAMGRAAGPRLKLVQVPGAGLDRVDLQAVPPTAALANVYGHAAGIAEYIIGAMLALNRDLVRLDSALRRGEWRSGFAVGTPPPPLAPELGGKTLGILGYGRIGQALAQRARAFGMTICAIRRNVAASAGDRLAALAGPERLDELLQRSDYLAVTLSLDATSRGLIGARELALLRPSARLINVARGEIIDEAALYQALAAGRLAGAALDVWYRYPTAAGPSLPSSQPFHELPNVLMTPHVSGATEGTRETRAREIAENIGRAMRGEAPLNLIARVQ